jgi:hypothetical protein
MMHVEASAAGGETALFVNLTLCCCIAASRSVSML